MKTGDTSLGGARKEFPATTMGLVQRLAADSRSAVEILGARYWKPVYQFVRLRWKRSNEEAKDLAQAFFLWLMEGDTLRRFAPERGSFRNFLKVLLGRFVGHEDEALGRLKRGGALKIVPLDADDSPLRSALPDGRATDPEAAFDQAWLDELVRQAVERVRQRFAASGRSEQFRVFAEYDLSGDGVSSYADVAVRLGMKESDVRNHLFSVREAVRAELRAELSQMTTDEQAFQEEWSALFGE